MAIPALDLMRKILDLRLKLSGATEAPHDPEAIRRRILERLDAFADAPWSCTTGKPAQSFLAADGEQGPRGAAGRVRGSPARRSRVALAARRAGSGIGPAGDALP